MHDKVKMFTNREFLVFLTLSVIQWLLQKTAKESAYLVNVLYKETWKFTFCIYILWRYSSVQWKRIDKYNRNRYGHIIVREIFASKSIYASIDLFPIEKEMREKKKANQETMININWKTLFCTIQRHIRRTVYQPHEP